MSLATLRVRTSAALHIIDDHRTRASYARALLCDADAGINFPTDKDEFEFVWDLWGDITEPTTSIIPSPVAVGNHGVCCGHAVL